MPEPEPQVPERRSHIARFEGGPRDGTMTVVLGLESGQPPEILLTPGRPDWVYVLGGAPRRDGSLPYVHMSPTKAALILSQGRRSSPARVSVSR
jgi:hypothetical protein